MGKLSPVRIGSLQRLWRATQYSFAGLRAAWWHETAFREELFALAVLAPLAVYLGDTAIERVLLIGSWLLVMLVELLNSAIEAVVDRIGAERHELAGRAKDLGSAAVFIALLLAALTWLLVLWP